MVCLIFLMGGELGLTEIDRRQRHHIAAFFFCAIIAISRNITARDALIIELAKRTHMACERDVEHQSVTVQS